MQLSQQAFRGTVTAGSAAAAGTVTGTRTHGNSLSFLIDLSIL
jgi:hypothetical protein